MKERKEYLIGWAFVDRYGVLDHAKIIIKAYTNKQAIAYFKTKYCMGYNYCKQYKEL